MGIMATVILGYGTFVEPFNMTVQEVVVDIPDYTGSPETFMLMSDLHIDRFSSTRKLATAIDLISDLDATTPVILLGDIIDHPYVRQRDVGILAKLCTGRQVYAVYGGHDYAKDYANNIMSVPTPWLTKALTDIGVTILDNTAVSTDTGIVLAGLSDIDAQAADPTFLADISAEVTTILLSHSPDGITSIPVTTYRNTIDLTISGHTHGGEVRLPVIGPIVLSTRVLPWTYDKGLFNYEHVPLFITSGINNAGTRMRLLNQPEIIILTIK